MQTLQELEAEYRRLEGAASSEQQRFGHSARPDFVRLTEAGRKANEARRRWMDAKREATP